MSLKKTDMMCDAALPCCVLYVLLLVMLASLLSEKHIKIKKQPRIKI